MAVTLDRSYHIEKPESLSHVLILRDIFLFIISARVKETMPFARFSARTGQE